MKLALIVLLLVAAGCNPFAEDIAIATARECDAMAALWYSTLDANEQREGRQENAIQKSRRRERHSIRMWDDSGEFQESTNAMAYRNRSRRAY